MSTKSKEKVQMDPAYIIKLTVTLLVTCVVVAAALGGVNAVTEEKIDAINWAKTVEAMKAVVADPDNTTFSDKLTLTDEMTAASGSDVPIATMVSPITSWGIPNFSATLPAPSTNQSAPFTRSTKPRASKAI